MSNHEFHFVAVGWGVFILISTVFWYLILSRLTVILKDRLSSTRSHQSITGMFSVVRFIARGSFKQTGDERLTAVCERLRKSLYAYIGVVAAYIIFLVIMLPRY